PAPATPDSFTSGGAGDGRGGEQTGGASPPSVAPGMSDSGARLADLGVVTDAASLRRMVSAAVAAAPPTTESGRMLSERAAAAPETRTCDGARRAVDGGLGPLVLVATAHYQGKPTGVLAYRALGGAIRSYVVEPDSCRVLLVDPG